MRLQSKTIIVTGSTTGIGKAIATRFVSEGAQVLIHGRDEARGRELVAELGPKAALHVDDLADPDCPPRLVAACVKAFGKIDGIVNNAAYVTRSDITSTDAKLFDAIMAINVRAPMLLVKAALDELAKAKGAILNIGSVNAHVGEGNLLAYAVSKGALQTLSRNFGDWLPRTHGVRCNHFNVGWTLTENEYHYKIKDGLPPDWPTKISKKILPTGALMKPETIAAAAVFYISDESRPITASVMDVEQYAVGGHVPEGKLME
jgi:NAD(P)-dependent dehydrogenase (short-subunit alcohol dehydrogenase family)